MLERKLSSWKKFLIWAGIAAIVCILIWLFLILRSPRTTTSMRNSVQSPARSNNNIQISPKEKITPKENVPKENVLSKNTDVPQVKKLPSSNQPVNQQSSGDAVINPIESIIVEERVTFKTKGGVALPPDEVPFIGGNANAYLEGPDGKVRLEFISPVGFKMQDDGSIVVMNHFSLQKSSDLYWQPVESLRNFDVISLPIITAFYGSSLESMVSFEVSLAVNGQNIWHHWLATNHPSYENILRINLGETFKRHFDEK